MTDTKQTAGWGGRAEKSPLPFQPWSCFVRLKGRARASLGLHGEGKHSSQDRAGLAGHGLPTAWPSGDGRVPGLQEVSEGGLQGPQLLSCKCFCSDGERAAAGQLRDRGGQQGTGRQHLDGQVPAESVHIHLLHSCPAGSFRLVLGSHGRLSPVPQSDKLKVKPPLEGHCGRQAGRQAFRARGARQVCSQSPCPPPPPLPQLQSSQRGKEVPGRAPPEDQGCFRSSNPAGSPTLVLNPGAELSGMGRLKLVRAVCRQDSWCRAWVL